MAKLTMKSLSQVKAPKKRVKLPIMLITIVTLITLQGNYSLWANDEKKKEPLTEVNKPTQHQPQPITKTIAVKPGIVSTKIGDSKISIAFSPSEGYKSALLDLIRNAKSNIKICMFNMDLREFLTELQKAHARGVNIEIILHHDPAKISPVRLAYLEELKKVATTHNIQTQKYYPESKTSVISSTTSLHHKFIVVDEKIVWTGSANISERGVNYNDESAVIMENKEIAKVYLNEFEWLKTTNPEEFGNKKLVSSIKLGETESIDILMLPGKEDATQYLLNLIDSAKEEIVILICEFTHNPIASKLIEKRKQGVKISILTNQDKSKYYPSDIKKMERNGVDIIYSNNDHTMHQRALVIDSKKALVGTANFSKKALEANVENIVVLENKEIAKAIKDEFKRCSSAIPYSQSKWGEKQDIIR